MYWATGARVAFGGRIPKWKSDDLDGSAVQDSLVSKEDSDLGCVAVMWVTTLCGVDDLWLFSSSLLVSPSHV